MALTFYGIPQSVTIRSLWMAHELALPYELIHVPPGDEGSRKPEYRRLNPNGRIPIMDDNGFLLWESVAINLYLAKKQGGSLAPATLGEDAQMTMWGLWTMGEIEPRVTAVIYNTRLLPEDQRDADLARAALDALKAPLGVLETTLAAGDGYLVGRRFTAADLNAISSLFYLRHNPEALADFPITNAWYRGGMQRPARQQAYALRGDPD